MAVTIERAWRGVDEMMRAIVTEEKNRRRCPFERALASRYFRHGDSDFYCGLVELITENGTANDFDHGTTGLRDGYRVAISTLVTVGSTGK